MLRNKYTVKILWLPIFVCVHQKVWRSPDGGVVDGVVWSWAICRFAPIFSKNAGSVPVLCGHVCPTLAP